MPDVNQFSTDHCLTLGAGRGGVHPPPFERVPEERPGIPSAPCPQDGLRWGLPCQPRMISRREMHPLNPGLKGPLPLTAALGKGYAIAKAGV